MTLSINSKSKMFRLTYICAGLLCLASCAQNKTIQNAMLQADSPYGICAHLGGGSENRWIPKNLQMMNEAGIRMVRVDFNWNAIETEPGVWDFTKFDRIVDAADSCGIKILAPLLYSVKWADPAYEHIPQWLEYVSKTVEHFKGRVDCWEVWNEPNLFWEGPDGKEYAKLLNVTYTRIKEVDPSATVLYGGTSGIPLGFIEDSFKEGAAKSFDVFNIHPYRGRLNSMQRLVEFDRDVKDLYALLEKYGVGDKPVWITEMGYSSWHNVNTENKDIFAQALTAMDSKEDGRKCCLVYDTDYMVPGTPSKDEIRSWFAAGDKVDFMPLAEFQTVDLMGYDAVLVPTWEELESGQVFEQIIPKVFTYMHKRGNQRMYIYGPGAITEDEQARYTQQSLLFTFGLGLRKGFVYEFMSPEKLYYDREDYFGLTTSQCVPKPSYYAYKTLTELYGGESVLDKDLPWNRDGVCQYRWTNPDGTVVWALWCPDGDKSINVKFGKGFGKAVDFVGNELGLSRESTTLDLGIQITFLVGRGDFLSLTK